VLTFEHSIWNLRDFILEIRALKVSRSLESAKAYPRRRQQNKRLLCRMNERVRRGVEKYGEEKTERGAEWKR
jgi:hypothetical protein